MKQCKFHDALWAITLVLFLCSPPVFAETFRIPKGSLKQALDFYSEVTGERPIYMNSLVEGVKSSGVTGEFSPEQAMAAILKGTGLTFILTDQGKMVLQKMEKTDSPVLQKDASARNMNPIPSISIDQVVITATKTPVKMKDVPATVNVVTDEDILLRTNTDNFVDTITTLPGVLAVRGGMSDTLVVRGMNPSIFINGRDMNFFASLLGSSQMGMDSIERIEIMKGPQAAIYGAKAVSGVVNMIQKKGDKNDPFAEIRGGFGQGDEYNGGISFGGGFDKVSYFFDLSATEQNNYKTPRGTIPYMESDSTNSFARFDYEFSQDHALTFDLSYNRSKKVVGGDGYYYVRSEWNNLYSFESEYQGGFLTYNGKFSDFLSVYANIGLGKEEYELIYGFPNYKPEHFLNRDSESNYHEDIIQGEIRGTINLLSDNRLRLIAGLQYRQTDLDGDSERTMGGEKQPFYNWDLTEEYFAPYAQVEFKPIPFAFMVAGIRYDDYKTGGKKMNATSPNIGLSIFPFAGKDYDWTTIWASYSKGFRTPGAAERYLPDFLGGNPDLEPEESRGWEIGLKQYADKWASIEASYFETDYTNLINLLQLGPMEWLFVNEADATYKGVELLTEIYPTDWLILHFGYTNMDREDNKNGQKLRGQPDQIFQYGVTIPGIYGFSFSLWGTQFKDFKWRSGKSHPSENTTVWNAKLMYRHDITDKISLMPYASVKNLSDEEYYGLSGESGIMESRTWHLGANLRFQF